MKKELTILIIDDYPIIIEAYKKILLRNKKYIVTLETSNSYDLANISLNSSTYDVVFIDLQLVASGNGINMCGERLAMLTRNKLPKAKIVLTISDDKRKVQSALKTIPHDGLLIKKDITSELILSALEIILDNSLFYSETVKNLITTSIWQEVFLDELNKKILYHLSIGVRTKNLVQYIPLSLSAIEKRKNNIRVAFNVKSDEQLLEKARAKGLI